MTPGAGPARSRDHAPPTVFFGSTRGVDGAVPAGLPLPDQIAEHNRQVADWLQTRGDQPAAARPRPKAAARGRTISAAAIPLTAILAVQAALSLRLVWSNTAYQDEGLYLLAGHLEIAHWLHGTPIPPFPSYFSGAPVLSPVLGAVADSLGGLAAARILSLAFMLGATGLLWAVTSRLYGRTGAYVAAVLWARARMRAAMRSNAR